MDINHIKQILNLVREHELTEFEIEHDGLRLKLRKDGAGGPVVAPAVAPPPPAVSAPGASVAQPGQPVAVPSAIAPGPGGPGGDAGEIELAVVKSPIVGTFYRSAEPGAASFVEVGTVVKKGQVLCIIEAMKLMNEIDSEYDGEIVNVYVENGQSVQYGERLFAIKAK
jgi:acetyl-CoA carboxylase biotin carboxyl carrier protein